MKINDNGVLRDMTPDEEAEHLADKQMLQQPSDDERLAVLEDALAEMMEVLLNG